MVCEDRFNDIVNDIITELTLTDKDTMRCYAWADGKKGNIALKTTSITRIKKFRQAIRDWIPDDDDSENAE